MEAPWHEDDALWEALEPILFDEARWKSAPAEVDGALARLGLSPPAAVLDLCCGVGRHSLELARRGFVVTGVDRTEAYLTAAREQAAAEGLSVEFVRGDMRDFVRPNAFDAAVNLFTSFGYFATEEENARALRNVCASLRPGGGFVLDVIGKEELVRNFLPMSWHHTPDGTLLLEEHTVIDDWTRIANRWILIPADAAQPRRTFSFTHFVYGASDLRALLLDAGFANVAFFGGLEGVPYDDRARRLVAVARKKG